MFTGIIECIGKVEGITVEGGNKKFLISSPISNELKVDQSIAHSGVCLTVVAVSNSQHEVVAIEETLSKSNLDDLQQGDRINLERCMQLNGRLDGHIVQGHVDTTATCTQRIEKDGSWLFTFTYQKNPRFVTVEKGSITVNGVSLTVIDSMINKFSVAIIPYTFENTSFKTIHQGSRVNLEFDIIGKYVARLMSVD